MRWIRPFEGEKVSPELRKQLQPPGLELPRRGAAAGGATSAPYSAAAAAASGTNSNLSQQLAVGPAGQPQKYPHHHMLPQQQHLQQLQEEQELQEHVKGSEADVLSNKVKAERRAALQQRHAAADIFRLIRRRDRSGQGCSLHEVPRAAKQIGFICSSLFARVYATRKTARRV